MSDQRIDISRYVSSQTDDVFAINGLPEEVVAVLFAFYSRSPNDLRTNLARLLAGDELDVETGSTTSFKMASDKARAFHEKWVVGYGHSSVAEHAIVHLALENVSIVASKIIEDLRLGSFTEKSTRYVIFDRNSFVVPDELSGSLRDEYVSTCSRLFDTYLGMVPCVIEHLRHRIPRAATMTDVGYESLLRANSLDICRGLLPASTKTNIGLTANARTIAHMIQKMGAHQLTESRTLASSMTTAGRTVVPTLLKYVEPSPMHSALVATMREVFRPVIGDFETKYAVHDQRGNNVSILRGSDASTHQIAHALAHQYAFTESPALDLFESIGIKSRETVTNICRAAISARGPHEGAPRAFEAAHYDVELILDYGAYRDLQRHRMLSPYARELTPVLGYTVPPELHALDPQLAAEYDGACMSAQHTWLQIMSGLKDNAHARSVAQYVLPLAYRIRVLWNVNLRELIHVIELRSGRGGHASYRALAQQLHAELIKLEPWLKDLIRVDLKDYGFSRS